MLLLGKRHTAFVGFLFQRSAHSIPGKCVCARHKGSVKNKIKQSFLTGHHLSRSINMKWYRMKWRWHIEEKPWQFRVDQSSDLALHWWRPKADPTHFMNVNGMNGDVCHRKISKFWCEFSSSQLKRKENPFTDKIRMQSILCCAAFTTNEKPFSTHKWVYIRRGYIYVASSCWIGCQMHWNTNGRFGITFSVIHFNDLAKGATKTLAQSHSRD